MSGTQTTHHSNLNKRVENTSLEEKNINSNANLQSYLKKGNREKKFDSNNGKQNNAVLNGQVVVQ